MRRSKGFVEAKAQPNAISPPFRAKASMVIRFLSAYLPTVFGRFFI